MSSYALVITFALAAPAPPAGPPVARHDTLPAACDAYAKVLIEALTAAGKSAVAVGHVPTDPRFGLATGSAVELELSAALKRARKDVVDPKATYEVRGEVTYQPAGDDPAQKLPVVTLRVVNAGSGRELAKIARAFALTDPIETARFFAPVVRLNPGGRPAENYGLLAKAIEAPRAHVENQRVRTQRECVTPLQVLVPKDGKYQPQEVDVDGGRPVVKLAKGDWFAPRVANSTDGDIGFRIFVDGMDTYHFAERRNGKPFASAYILKPHTAGYYPGWIQTEWKWDLFRNGMPGELDLPPARDTKWGSITAVVWAVHRNPNPPPQFTTDPPLDVLSIRLDR